MSVIVKELKLRIMDEFPNAEGKQVKSFYRFKDSFNFVEILGTNDEYTQIRVSTKLLTLEELSGCVIENNTRSLRARFWVRDYNSIDSAMNLIRKSHSSINQNSPIYLYI